MTAPQREFTLVRDFDVPRDLVYRVWTEPDHMSQWLFPRDVATPQETISQDLRVGGLWRWMMVNEQDGTRYPTVARFREVVEPERLVFTWGDEDNEGALITVDFAEHAPHAALDRPGGDGHRGKRNSEGLERAAGQPGVVRSPSPRTEVAVSPARCPRTRAARRPRAPAGWRSARTPRPGNYPRCC
jgi:uncharacterized protein YndB with AHSA1/START domain